MFARAVLPLGIELSPSRIRHVDLRLSSPALNAPQAPPELMQRHVLRQPVAAHHVADRQDHRPPALGVQATVLGARGRGRHLDRRTK